jgi:hypothetical protein
MQPSSGLDSILDGHNERNVAHWQFMGAGALAYSSPHVTGTQILMYYNVP